ncbi:MAG: TonB-dependent receptor [Thermonemataceae bacterium]|nr:TonB-dependent receptor [Thermonemataceae bacterium]
MAKIIFLLLSILSFYTSALKAQYIEIQGFVKSKNKPVAFAVLRIKDTNYGAESDTLGFYRIRIPQRNTQVTLLVNVIGFYEYKNSFILGTQTTVHLDIDLSNYEQSIEEVVVTATKTPKKNTDTPIIVNILDSQTLNNVQACNLAEGLKFQPGLRVETDCQTCNYTQLRMNGLSGQYSQILINGRPILSSLTSLYGLEQLPTNMIDRVEVIRGGGASLYGSSAVGGTVNILTKIPQKNDYEVNYSLQSINGKSTDHQFNANLNRLFAHKKIAVATFFNHRNRDYYDHNSDNFSEIPLLKSYAIGFNSIFLPEKNQKLELSLSYLNEYRYGGEMVRKAAHLAQQAEERTHHIYLGNLDYQVNFNENKSSFITYIAWQKTDREHYTGVIPDDSLSIEEHLLQPPYGTSYTQTLQAGGQLNHSFNILKSKNILTLGTEYTQESIFDEIKAYQYLIDQKVENIGIFLQNDWEILPKLNLLYGIRADKHNTLPNWNFSPRASLLYKLGQQTQIRASYGEGFKAPQAFDTDLHIAFAGGGVSRVRLAPNLTQERSQSFSASINYDKANEYFVAGFTLELFRTSLKDAFYTENIGEDAFGEILEKKNGRNATVQGLTIELRANFRRKLQIESGFTLQSSLYKEPISYIENLAPQKDFLRTPQQYGFVLVNISPNKKYKFNFNMVYTGSMLLAHFAGAPNQNQDVLLYSKDFVEMSTKGSYNVHLKALKSNMEIFGGIKNLLNMYQNDFDIGKNRDSNYIYGTALPRTFFVGIKFYP